MRLLAGDDLLRTQLKMPISQQRRGVVDGGMAEEDRAFPAPAPLVHHTEGGDGRSSRVPRRLPVWP
jgi:hypothetical protein